MPELHCKPCPGQRGGDLGLLNDVPSVNERVKETDSAHTWAARRHRKWSLCR